MSSECRLESKMDDVEVKSFGVFYWTLYPPFDWARSGDDGGKLFPTDLTVFLSSFSFVRSCLLLWVRNLQVATRAQA